MNKLIKVYDVPGSKKIIIREHVGHVEVEDTTDKIKLSRLLNGITPIVEYKGYIVGLDLEEFVSEVINNFDEYIDKKNKPHPRNNKSY